MLELCNVKKTYGNFIALDGLELKVKKGALYGLVGLNGAGKTTAIKVMTGLLRPDSGQVMINGRNILSQPSEIKKEIGYVPDSLGVYDNMKVAEYMEFFAGCHRIDGLKARERCHILLEQVGLDMKLDFYAEALSRGMQQRLNLARALIHDPQMLIMDEPSLGLDPRTRIEFRQILQELNDQGKTILISSHVLSELSEICTDIGIIDQGKMVLGGNIHDMMTHIYTSNSLLISIYDGKEKALQILRNHPFVRTIMMKKNDIRIGFAGDKEDEVMLLGELVDAQVPVYAFYRETGSLETLFMQITNHENVKVVTGHES